MFFDGKPFLCEFRQAYFDNNFEPHFYAISFYVSFLTGCSEEKCSSKTSPFSVSSLQAYFGNNLEPHFYVFSIFVCFLTGVFRGEMFFDDKPFLCEFIASMCLTACFAAFLSLTFITGTQYLFVCYNQTYYKVGYKRDRSKA